MKIFQVITASEYGGAQSVVASLLQKMNEDPKNEVFVVYGGEGEAWQDLDVRIKRIRLCPHRKQMSIKDIGIFFQLLYLKLKYRPDIVHLHSSKMGAIGRLVFSKNKIAYTIHGFDSVRLAFRKFLFIERALRKRSPKITAISKHDVHYLKLERITDNPILVYNGVPDHYKSGSNLADESIKSKLGLIRDKYAKIVMCIARISHQKKFDLFLDIAEQMPQYAFVWIGNKEDLENLPENVFCLGETNAAYECLQYADLFILPSNYEGLPISLLEALSFGVPVVASSVGGVTEILDEHNGFAVDNTVYDFKDKIDKILSLNATEYSQMSQYARNSYLEKFTIDKMVEEYKKIYTDILSK